MIINRQYKPEQCCIKPSHSTQRNLEQPFIDKAREVIVGTDGHCMAVIPVEDVGDHPKTYVNREALEWARKRLHRSYGTITVKPDGITIDCPGGGPTFPMEDMRYENTPTWQPAFDSQVRKLKDPKCRAVGINVDLLVRVCRALGTKNVALVIDEDPNNAVTVYPEDPPEASGRDPIGLVMPRRLWKR